MKATKNINKILVGALAVLVLAGPAFAQSKEQQKVDSLQRVLANAERTQKRAEGILKQDINNEAKYQAVKAARANHDRINKELDAAIEAKEEADRKAREAAEEAKQKAREAKGWKLYQQKFSTFDQIEGIDSRVKQEIAWMLSCYPKFDVKSASIALGGCSQNGHISGITLNALDAFDTRWVKLSGRVGREEALSYAGRQAKLVNLALKCRQDPALLHETLQEQEARKKMGWYFFNYYKGYTGEKLPEIPNCDTIELYEVDVPNWTSNFFYDEINCRYYGGHCIDRPKGGTYFYYKCDGKTELEIYRDTDHKSWCEDIFTNKRKQLPGKLIKTFKVEDFM